MKLALVDIFGDAVETDFDLYFISNVPGECATAKVSSPLMPD